MKAIQSGKIYNTVELETQLKNSSNFKNFFDCIPDYLFVVSLEGNIIEVNKSALTVLGYQRDELIGHKIYKVHPSYRLAEATDLIQEVISGNKDSIYLPFVTKNGMHIPCESKVKRGYWDQQEVLFSITKNLVEFSSNEKYARYFQTTPAMSIIVELETGIFIEVNNMFVDQTGYQPEELIGQKVYKVLQIDKPLNNQIRDTLKNEGKLSNYEIDIKTRNGHIIPILLSAEKINLQGIDYFYAVGLDISKRKETEKKLAVSQQKFNSLFENMDAAIAYHKIITDAKGTPVDYIFLEINPNFEKITGFKKEEIINQRASVVYPDLQKAWIEKYGKVALTGQPLNFMSYSSDLDRYYSAWAYCPEYGHFAISYIDVTGEENALEELFKNERMLNEASSIGKIGSWEYDFDQSILNVSDEWKKIFLDDMQLNTNSLNDLFINVHPDDIYELKNALSFESKGSERVFIDYRVKVDEKLKYIHSEIIVEKDSKHKLYRLFGVCQDVTEKHKNAYLIEKQTSDIKHIIQSIQGKEGQEYYNTITQNLQKISESDYTFIGLINNEAMLESIAHFYKGKKIDNLSYALDGTPCEEVFGKSTTIYDNNLITFYPNNQYLNKIKAEAYIGTPINDHLGNPLGVLVALYNHPIADTRFIETIFELFAASIGSEIVRTNAQRSLKESRQRFKWLSESTFEGIITTKDGKIIDSNNQIQQIYGYTKDEVESIFFEKFFHPDDYHMVMKKIKNRETGNYQYRGITKNGNIIYLDAYVKLLDYEGQEVRMAVIRDVTKQKKQELELVEREQMLRIVFDNTPAVMFLLNDNTEIEQVNKYGYSYLSTKSKNVKGFKCGDALGCIGAINDNTGKRESKICRNCVIRNATESTLATGMEHLKLETDLVITKNSELSIKTFLTSTNLIELNGKRQVLLTLDDITDRKQMEEELVISNEAAVYNENRYKLLTDLTFEGIVLHRDDKILNVNKSLCNMTGYDAGELVGNSFLKFLIPEKYKLLSKNKLHEDYSSPYEIELLRKNGTMISVEIEGRYFNQSNNKIRVSAIRDISERREIEKKVLNAILETEETERAYFAQELHDGLGPILSNVQMYFQWLVEADENREFVTEKGNKSLQSAFQTLREISSKLSPHILHNFGLVRAIHSFIDQVPDKSVINIIFDNNIGESRYDSNIEITLYRVITELINNTFKYANATVIRIQVNQVQNELKIGFVDNGKGFNVMMNMNKAKGFGLFNMQSRIKTLMGNIEFLSDEGTGLTVKIAIPAKKLQK